jgi:hypothetical protein
VETNFHTLWARRTNRLGNAQMPADEVQNQFHQIKQSLV